MKPVQVGRPPREVILDSEGIPAPVMIALEARAAGNSWKQAAEIGQIHVTALREWRKHDIVRKTLNELIRDKLAGATATLVDATPRLAEELIDRASHGQEEQAVFPRQRDGIGVPDRCNTFTGPIAG